MIVDCGDPDPPRNGTIDNYPHSRESGILTYHCNMGFRPSAIMTSTCKNTTQWVPLPLDFNCTRITGNSFILRSNYNIFFATAIVVIYPLERAMQNLDISCPGDIIPYNCSIHSNSETIQLTWRVLLNEKVQINITYNGSSELFPKKMQLGTYANTYLSRYIQDAYIESILELRLPPDLFNNMQVSVDCSTEDLQWTDSHEVVILSPSV